MEIINSTARAATDIGETATATLGAISGAVIGSVVGTIKGAAEGATTGARRGSHSTPAAALTLGAIALTGIAQWPIVAVAGGTALVLNVVKPGKPAEHQSAAGSVDTRSTAPTPKKSPATPATDTTTASATTPSNTPPTSRKMTTKKTTTAL